MSNVANGVVPVNFTYANCMNSSLDLYPGFIADKVEMAGKSIDGLGDVFLWAGDLFTKYGFSGGMLSTFGYSIGKVAEYRANDVVIRDFAYTRLKENGMAGLLGVALAAIGMPVKLAGSAMAARETQCKIAMFLTTYGKSTKDL